MSTNFSATSEEVGSYYDESEAFFTDILGDDLHFGYWRDAHDPASFAQARHQLTDLLGERLPLSIGKTLLDVGCGTGGPALRLAGRSGCGVEGISVSPGQVARANANADAAGLAGRVTFRRADALAMPFADATFDAALALESFPHMDTAKALAEVARTLRPGGVLAAATLFEVLPIVPGSPEAVSLAEVPLYNWYTFDGLVDLVNRSGLEVEAAVDITENVADRTYDEMIAIMQTRRAELTGKPGEKFAEQFMDYYPPWFSAWRKHCGYAMVVARRIAA